MLVDIAGRKIGPGEPTYVICEAGVNHGGDIRQAERLIDAAKGAGADAVKFQCWSTARLLSPDSPMFRTLLPLELSEGQLRHLKAYADERGITFLCTPDQIADVILLEDIGVAAFKIGSGNLRNGELLRHVASYGKPVILSTGMSTLLEVQAAVDAIMRDGGNDQLVLLHCVSVYPPSNHPQLSATIDANSVRWHCVSAYPPEDHSGRRFDPELCNLRAMVAMGKALGGLPVGYSDHTREPAAAHAAVTLGACVYEAHLSLGGDGPDAGVSLGGETFRHLVQSIRWLEKALGDGIKRPMAAEQATREYVKTWRRGA